MAKEPVQKQGFPQEMKGLLLLLFSLTLLLSLLSFQSSDTHANWLGLMGWGLSFAFSYAFGINSYLITLFIGWIGWKWLLAKQQEKWMQKGLYFSLFILSSGLLLNLIADYFPSLAQLLQERVYTESHFFDFPYPHEETRYNWGGVPLYYLYKDIPTLSLQHLLSDFGVALTSCVTLVVSFFLFTELPFIDSMRSLKALLQTFLKKEEKQEEQQPIQSMQQIEETLTKHTVKPLYSPQVKLATPSPEIKLPKEEKRPSKKSSEPLSSYPLPPLSLLNQPQKVDQPSLKKELKRQAEILEETLASFGIEGKVGEIQSGPTITSFEVHPAVGVKVQKIKTLENDIALNLQAKSIRIIAPIPGKAAVGVEVPSLYPQAVSFKELLVDYQNSSKKMGIPLLLGKAVAGDNVIADLTKMPHCLIAGATGSGKSVCINTIIMSILMTARPDEVKLIMIDPKKVELTPYTNLPHMIAPVITEPQGAYAALNWLVKEMQQRYEILKQLGMRNITAFNQRTRDKDLEASLSIPVPDKMPFMVAIIDEFADLMMASSSDLETPIARIAQMARAVGIHLILATQRPSREVITGLIKANFPTRIAFKVANRVNSQIILDDIGAESLLGNGDLLFLPPGTSSLIRAQGVYISDEEIQRAIAFICEQMPTRYLIDSFDTFRLEELPSNDDDNPKDTLYEQARTLVIDTKTASTTFLQRKLKIGYARAASLMDELEQNGIIGPQEGAKPRRILASSPMGKQDTSYDTQELVE